MQENVKRRVAVELLTLATSDGWALDAVMYAPGLQSQADTVLLHLHGKGASMLDIHARWLPDLLPSLGHFAINMRCHSLAYNTDREDTPVAGGMYESLEEGEYDIAAAVNFLRSEGYRKIIISSHSSGGFYAGMYTPAGDDIVGRIFLSPLTDNKIALSWWFPESSELDDALAMASNLIEQGRPDEIMPLPSWYWGISARSLVERASQPDSDVWISAVNALPSPVLMAWGATESRDKLWNTLSRQLTPPTDALGLEGSDHWYHGHEDTVAEHVARFVYKITGKDPR